MRRSASGTASSLDQEQGSCSWGPGPSQRWGASVATSTPQPPSCHPNTQLRSQLSKLLMVACEWGSAGCCPALIIGMLPS